MTNQARSLMVRIRTVVAEDYDGLLELWQAAGLSIRPAGRESPECFRNQLEYFAAFYLVAEDGAGRILGSVFGTHDQRKAWINRLAVHPDHRRRGVAAALVRACESALIDAGFEIVAALVEPDNEASLAVFRKLGYLADAPVIYLRKLNRPDA